MPVPNLAPGTELRTAIEELADDHLTYLLGAGASVASGLPVWSKLVRELLSQRKLSPRAVDVLVSSKDNLFTAEAAFRANISQRQRDGRIFKALYGTSDTAVASDAFTPAPMHLAVAADAIRRGRENVKLMTLNYDDLLEEAIVAALLDDDPTLTIAHAQKMAPGRGASRRANQPYVVHHLHGYLPRHDTRANGDPLVLTQSDYNDLLNRTAPWQQSELSSAFQFGNLLMVGTSYSDPEIRAWLPALREQNPGSKAVALLPRQGLGLNAADADLVRDVLTAQWSQVGVDAHIVDDYATATQIIREVSHINRADYRNPTDRVAAVLADRIAKFDRKQAADVRVLADQATNILAPAVGGGTVNLTLWLHNGAKCLTRWATNDRKYLNASTLRHIDADMSSPWIVAQAACADSELIEAITVDTTNQDRATTGRTGRWSTVAAKSVLAVRNGGPTITVGAISAAFERPITDHETADLYQALAEISEAWGDTLSDA